PRAAQPAPRQPLPLRTLSRRLRDGAREQHPNPARCPLLHLAPDLDVANRYCTLLSRGYPALRCEPPLGRLGHERLAPMTLFSADVPAPAGAYSQGRRIGPFVQISGQVAKDLDGDVAAQTAQALERVQTLLALEGLSWRDVLIVRVYLAADEYWDDMDAAYRR